MEMNALSAAEIFTPIGGTVRWIDGKASGVWGIDIPCTPQVMRKDGTMRALTRNERRWLARIERRATQ